MTSSPRILRIGLGTSDVDRGAMSTSSRLPLKLSTEGGRRGGSGSGSGSGVGSEGIGPPREIPLDA